MNSGRVPDGSSQHSAFKGLTAGASAEDLNSNRSPFSGSLDDGELPQHIQITANNYPTNQNPQRPKHFNTGAPASHLTPREGTTKSGLEDSPDFNRIDIVSVTDDLTVSNTNTDNDTTSGGKSYRGGHYFANGQRVVETLKEGVIRSQNRTFADSVLDHHASQMGIVPPADSDKHTKTALKRDNRDQHGPMRGALTDGSGAS